MLSISKESIKSIIKDAGLKCTIPRMMILELLTKEHRPVSINEITKHLNHTVINMVTIYRTMDTFVEKKLVRHVESIGHEQLFEAHLFDTCQTNHPHFVCRKCKKIECMENTPKIKVPPFALITQFKVEEIHIQVRGICTKCS